MKKHLTRIFVGLLAALLLCTAAFAIEVPEYNENAFYVTDEAGVLSDATRSTILKLGDQLQEATGAEVVVLTENFIGGADIEEYAYTVFNDWQLGDPEKNNGVLLLLVIGAQDYYVLQGIGLENTLTAGKLQTILDTYLEPDFAAEDYDAGVLKTYQALVEAVEDIYGAEGASQAESAYDTYYEDEYTAPSQSSTQKRSSGILSDLISGSFLLILIVLLVVFAAIRRILHPFRGVHHAPPPRRGFWGFGPFFGMRPGPRHGAPPPPPPHRGPGGFGGPRPGGMGGPRPGGFGGSRPGGSRPGSFGGAGRSSGFGGHSGGSFGGRAGGGGGSRGGGAGRH